MSQQLSEMVRTIEYPVMALRLPAYTAIEPYLKRIDANRWYSNFGPLAGSLGLRLAAHYSVTAGSVCLMANATAGLTAALQEAGQGMPGGFCILPSWTFAASVHAVVLSGLRPLFVDIDADHGGLTPAIAAAAISDDVAAIMVVSTFGQPVDPAPWENLRAATGVEIVIDAAAAFDTVIPSSIATVVSLHATKPLACGEGAFVISEDEGLIERLRRRSNFGFAPDRQAQVVGNNAKMSEYHAAVAHASLDEWPVTREHLMHVGQYYRDCLADIPSVAVQPGWGDKWISTTLNIRLGENADLDRLCADLRIRGVETRSWWGRGCHTQPAFACLERTPLPVTDMVANHTLGLPFSSQLAPSDVDRIVSRLQNLLG
jgi:dTDP-4-amino-4,6-dideoxygalactose transaminase